MNLNRLQESSWEAVPEASHEGVRILRPYAENPANQTHPDYFLGSVLRRAFEAKQNQEDEDALREFLKKFREIGERFMREKIGGGLFGGRSEKDKQTAVEQGFFNFLSQLIGWHALVEMRKAYRQAGTDPETVAPELLADSAWGYLKANTGRLEAVYQKAQKDLEKALGRHGRACAAHRAALQEVLEARDPDSAQEKSRSGRFKEPEIDMKGSSVPDFPGIGALLKESAAKPMAESGNPYSTKTMNNGERRSGASGIGEALALAGRRGVWSHLRAAVDAAPAIDTEAALLQALDPRFAAGLRSYSYDTKSAGSSASVNVVRYDQKGRPVGVDREAYSEIRGPGHGGVSVLQKAAFHMAVSLTLYGEMKELTLADFKRFWNRIKNAPAFQKKQPETSFALKRESGVNSEETLEALRKNLPPSQCPYLYLEPEETYLFFKTPGKPKALTVVHPLLSAAGRCLVIRRDDKETEIELRELKVRSGEPLVVKDRCAVATVFGAGEIFWESGVKKPLIPQAVFLKKRFMEQGETPSKDGPFTGPLTEAMAELLAAHAERAIRHFGGFMKDLEDEKIPLEERIAELGVRATPAELKTPDFLARELRERYRGAPIGVDIARHLPARDLSKGEQETVRRMVFPGSPLKDRPAETSREILDAFPSGGIAHENLDAVLERTPEEAAALIQDLLRFPKALGAEPDETAAIIRLFFRRLEDRGDKKQLMELRYGQAKCIGERGMYPRFAERAWETSVARFLEESVAELERKNTDFGALLDAADALPFSAWHYLEVIRQELDDEDDDDARDAPERKRVEQYDRLFELLEQKKAPKKYEKERAALLAKINAVKDEVCAMDEQALEDLGNRVMGTGHQVKEMGREQVLAQAAAVAARGDAVLSAVDRNALLLSGLLPEKLESALMKKTLLSPSAWNELKKYLEDLKPETFALLIRKARWLQPPENRLDDEEGGEVADAGTESELGERLAVRMAELCAEWVKGGSDAREKCLAILHAFSFHETAIFPTEEHMEPLGSSSAEAFLEALQKNGERVFAEVLDLYYKALNES